MKRTLVIGAGITGVTTAYYLAKAGHEVTIYEKEKYPGMVTSYANGGQLSVSNSETWNTWSNVANGMKWMFNPDAPLLVRPKLSIPKIKWLIGFLRHTAFGSQKQNTIDTISLGLEARNLYYEIAEETGISFDLSENGILHFYRSEKYFNKALDSNSSIYNMQSVDRKILSPKEVLSIEPKLENAKDIVGGIYTPGDAMGDIHKFCFRLATYISRTYNVTFMFNHELDDVGLLNSYYDNVVICAGAKSSHVASMFGEKINVYPVKGYSITITDALARFPKVSLLDDESKIVTSTLGDRLRIAGTAELDDWNLDIRKSRIDPLLKWVHKTFPQIDTRDFKPWAGLRPMTPSMMPIVRRAKSAKNVYLNTGHGHLGWTLAPATAKAITNIIEEDYGS
jgi:D-amino-acid dehydrogenase